MILEQRKKVKALVSECVHFFPQHTAERLLKETGELVTEMQDDGSVRRPRWWTNFNPFRRRKKDWNEVLRLSDYCTMNYVE